ncbi:MAG: glutaredoxin domain-containing protein [Anaerolineales bacterium]
MGQFKIKVYGTDWCGDCIRVKRFFHKYQIPYEWINIDENKEAEKLVIEINHGNRSVPTIFLHDGSILVEPSDAELKEKIYNIQEGVKNER